jgi:hypothetical protein
LTVSDTNYKIICSLDNLQVRFGNDGFGLKLQVGVDISYLAGVWSCNVLQASVLNKWTHVAFTRSGGVCRLFVNGVLQNINSGANPSTYPFTSFTDPTVDIPANNFTVGDGSATLSFVGNISNLRVLIGTALYTASFTVPIAPLSAIANTQLLILQDNRFKDNSASPKTLTPTGTITVQAFQPFSPTASYTPAAYGGSGYFDGSSRLQIANNAAFNFGTGSFTIEFWLYCTVPWTSLNNPGIAGQKSDDFSNGWQIYRNTSVNTDKMNIRIMEDDYPSTAVPVTGSWEHWAVVRNGTTLTWYKNGVASGSYSGVSANITDSGGTFFMGFTQTWSGYFRGYISNLRIVKGTAVYTANFTPPAAPVTAITNTVLLTNFTNAGIYDAAVQNNAITVGDAQASTTQYKWSPTSMKFDGTGDYLLLPDSVNLQIGSGDYTMEFWLYPVSLSGSFSGIIDTRTSGGVDTNGFAIYFGTSQLRFRTNGSDILTYSSFPTGAWTYVAITRSGSGSNNTKLFINGTQQAQATNTTSFTQTSRFAIGTTYPLNGDFYNGYIQDLRITCGVARTITTPTAAFPTTAVSFTPAVPDAPIIANLTTITNTSVKIGYMAPLLNGGSTITSYTAVSTPGGITGTSVTSRSGTITVSGLSYRNTYTFAVYATNAVGTSTYSASSKSVTTGAPPPEGNIFILSDMDLALTNLVMLNTTIASGTTKAKSYALATIYGSD